MFNIFKSGETIDVVSSDTSSNLTDTTTTRNSDSTKNIDTSVTSRVNRTSTDPDSGNVNVNVNSGVLSNDRTISPIKPITPITPIIPINPQPSGDNDTDDKILGMSKTLFYILLVILIILGIGGGYMYYSKNIESKTDSKLNTLSSKIN